ncbi:PAS domain-containing sensor histidine kinase [Sphingomonas solaris]|uniref:histidine kinase n=1 Tax=Alterirhizorhabdus solaris TaxID=2529389 RepID=A0A558RC06_9SPHN|nr:HWE histidine kinase domain-containing protein [Sphingomonas solaris]TVV76868.1 PAS domain S-box protein [Sphingomonas solaris]
MAERVTLPSGGGEMGARIRAFDWSATPLGPPETWPAALRVSLGLCLNSAFPMCIYWGPELTLLYNDGWAPVPGRRHPDALGRPAREVWPDIWPIVGPQLAEVLATGHGYAVSDQLLPMTRAGQLEESYWDYSFTPITGEDGRVVGILNQGHEVTARVFDRQRDALLLGLGDRMRLLDDAEAITRMALATLGPHLGAARVGYGEIDHAAGTLDIVANWRRDEAVLDLSGPHRLGAFGDDLHRALTDGRMFAVADAHEDPRVAGRPVAARYGAAGIRAGLVVPVLKGGAYAAAIFVHDDRPRGWTDHHERLLGLVAERIWQERARAQAQRALRESEIRPRLIFEQANDIVFTADLDQVITGANPAAGLALGASPQALVGRSIGTFIAPEEFARTTAMLRRKLADGGTTRYEVEVQAPEGRRLHWEISSTLARDGDGAAIGLHAIARDVTDRHRHELEQRRLIDELNHRVKNVLAMVQGLASQSFKGDKPLTEAQAAFQARLAALASAHDLLTREKWEGATLDEVVAGGTHPFEGYGTRVSTAGPAVRLQPKTAVSLLMALHELSTNALHHGALSAPAGRVDVRWWTEGDRLLIEWQESGGPAVTAPERRGFGLRMVERALAADLSARVTVAFAGPGLSCRIDAPLPAHDDRVGA